MMQYQQDTNHESIQEILDFLGIEQPTKAQYKLIASLLSGSAIKQPVFFPEILSRREINCLHWTARGKTSDEIAQILRIRHTTVASYKREILRKLNCTNMAQAIFQGIRFGYIEPYESKANRTTNQAYSQQEHSHE